MLGFISSLRFTLAFLAATIPSYCQRAAGSSSPSTNKSNNAGPNLRVSSRLVIVDVVVRKGEQPVGALKQDDFALYEDGVQQTIRYFSPHFTDKVTRTAIAEQARPPSLPPDTWTNLPIAHVDDSVTVLLLDGLNTQPTDVIFVRREMIRYLKTMPPGQRIAVFALGQKLRILQGFTTDTSHLIVALEKPRATSPSSLLPPEEQKLQEKEVLDDMATSGVSELTIANSLNFMGEADTAQTTMRVNLTLEAMQQLARYLAGIPERKNLVWFSGSFPVQFFSFVSEPDVSAKNGVPDIRLVPTATYDEQVKETADMLADARVAVYPVDARGVLLEPMFKSTNPTALGAGGPMVGPQGGTFSSDQQISQPQMAAEHATMDVLAQNTGGRAVYDSNGLQEAMADALSDGSNFYTLAYTPSNKNFNGAKRDIEVRLTHEKAQLSYRRSYYADATELSQHGGGKDSRAVFLQSMQRGAPSSSQIVFDVRVAASDQRTPAGNLAGANTAMKNRAARYAIDYATDLHSIDLTEASNGIRQGRLSALVIAYDREGNRLNWVGNDVPISLDQAAWSQYGRYGFQIHQILDLPVGDIYLRVGLYDSGSGHVGTVEIPLQVSGYK